MAVGEEQVQGRGVAVEAGGTIQVIHEPVTGALVTGPCHARTQTHAAFACRKQAKSMVDRLLEALITPGEDRRADVVELGEVGDLDAIGMANETHQKTRDHQRVF